MNNGTLWAKWTPERARKRLEEEIKEAHQRYEKRMKMHAEWLTKPDINSELRAKREARWIQAEELRAKGFTYRKIGEILGVSPTRASEICNHRKIEREIREENEAYDKELALALAIGATKPRVRTV